MIIEENIYFKILINGSNLSKFENKQIDSIKFSGHIGSLLLI